MWTKARSMCTGMIYIYMLSLLRVRLTHTKKVAKWVRTVVNGGT